VWVAEVRRPERPSTKELRRIAVLRLDIETSAETGQTLHTPRRRASHVEITYDS